MPWLNPVTDFLSAMKSGASAGAEIARIKSDNAQAAAKLDQATRTGEDQNALGYAKLASEERTAQETAAEKLQAAMAQQSALNDYRNRSLDQRSDAADALNQYRGNKLDLAQSNSEALNQYRMTRAGQHEAYLNYLGNKMSDVDRLDYANGLSTLLAANKTLAQPFQTEEGKAAAMSMWGQSDATLQRIKSKYGLTDQGGGSTTTTGAEPSFSDALTNTITGGGSGTADETSAADALTSGTSNTLPPAATNSANPYQAGKRYGNLRYVGGDPNDQNSWEATE